MFSLFAKKNVELTEEEKMELQECEFKLEAIGKCQATIEFHMDGTIIKANDNFLRAVGYRLEEIVGQHHRMFVRPAERQSRDYKAFWDLLNRGDFHNGKFCRIRKDGEEVWIRAYYFPLKDAKGKPYKVVKICSAITEQVKLQQRNSKAGAAVSGSIEEMVDKIREISGYANQTAALSMSTQQEIQSTTESVKKLDESSRTIESVVELIRSLADQTNLLALNATIESARAGEAGRGFAVVANEVKELAKQTSEATESIDSSVTEIQSQISHCVESATSVFESIRSVSESMTSVASAVEQQSATMNCLNETAIALRDS